MHNACCAVQILTDLSASAQRAAKVPAVNLLSLTLQQQGASKLINSLQQVELAEIKNRSC